MRRLRAYVESIPRFVAGYELMALPARQVASGNLKRADASRLLSHLRRLASGSDSGARRRADGLEAFALIRQMNAKARAAGRLWEQLHPPEATA